MLTYYLLPFWAAVLFVLRSFFSTYTAVLIASLFFGAFEYGKARRAEDYIWKTLKQDISVIGHRACAINAPENTLAGVREAARLGVRAIEFDIMLTADDEPIIFHDSKADRTTDGTGEVSSMTWSDIQKLDASAKFKGSGYFNSERVPHLREMLQECKKLGLKVFLDMKGSRPLTMAKVVADMSQEFPDLHEWAAVCSFYPQLLFAVKLYTPRFVTILTHRPWVLTYSSPDGPERNGELWKRIAAPIADVLLELSNNYLSWYLCGVSAVFMEQEVVSIGNIKYWNSRGIDVVVWTVNKPEIKTYLSSMGIPYITDDCRSHL